MPVKRNRPKAVIYILASVVIAAAIWSTIGAPHGSKPVTQQFARNLMR